jgi:hypothetical protein
MSALGACEKSGSQPGPFNVRRWYVSKIAPKHYGDKLENEDRIDHHGGGPLHVNTMRQGLLMKPETLAQLQENRIEVLMTAIRYQHPIGLRKAIPGI